MRLPLKSASVFRLAFFGEATRLPWKPRQAMPTPTNGASRETAARNGACAELGELQRAGGHGAEGDVAAGHGLVLDVEALLLEEALFLGDQAGQLADAEGPAHHQFFGIGRGDGAECGDDRRQSENPPDHCRFLPSDALNH